MKKSLFLMLGIAVVMMFTSCREILPPEGPLEQLQETVIGTWDATEASLMVDTTIVETVPANMLFEQFYITFNREGDGQMGMKTIDAEEDESVDIVADITYTVTEEPNVEFHINIVATVEGETENLILVVKDFSADKLVLYDIEDDVEETTVLTFTRRK